MIPKGFYNMHQSNVAYVIKQPMQSIDLDTPRCIFFNIINIIT